MHADRLTSREREIIRALGRGASDKEIAEDLGIAVSTVQKHVANGMRALRAHSRAHAVGLLHSGTRVAVDRPHR